jgi:phage antirepressor YoqD-like protein
MKHKAVWLLFAAPLSQVAIAQDANPASAEENDLSAAKQREELRQLELENEKRLVELQDAKRKSLTDAIPDSETSGSTTVKDNAGKIEAAGLSTMATNALAKLIAQDARQAVRRSVKDVAPPRNSDPCALLLDEGAFSIREILSGDDQAGTDTTANTLAEEAAKSEGPASRLTGSDPPLLLLPGADTLSFAAWEQFRFRHCAIKQAFADGIEAAAPHVAVVPPPSPNWKGGPAYAYGPALALTTGISAVSKLMQLVTPDWEVGTVSATVPDKALLAAVAREYIRQGSGRIYWAGQVSKSGGGDEVFGRLAELDIQDRRAARLLTSLEPKLATATKSKKRKLVETYSGPIAALKAARLAYSTLLTSMGGKEAEAGLPINRVVTEAAAATLLQQDGVVLNVNVGTAGGGHYTRKVLWNALGLGGPPFYVTGGTTVHYLAVRPSDQQLLGGGNLSCNAGYLKINRVAAIANDREAAGRLRCR